VHYVYTGNLIEHGVWGGCLVITTARTFATWLLQFCSNGKHY